MPFLGENTRRMVDEVNKSAREMLYPLEQAAAKVDAAAARMDGIEDIQSEIEESIARIDPGSAGVAGQVLQQTSDGPKWTSKNVVDIRDVVSDTSGTADMRYELQGAINSLAAGSVLYVPADAVLNLSDTIVVSKELTIRGEGELRWTAGITNKPGLQITGDYVSIEGVKLTNPNELASASGAKNTGIEIRANHASVLGCRLDRWVNSIIQMPHGEYFGATIVGNTITNCIGTGSEDRGDGILMIGSGVIVANNIVSAKPGTDARCGIVIEGLSQFQGTPISSYATDVSATGFIVTNNIVTGPFRRAIHAEGAHDFVISDNTVYGMTWWGIIVWSANQGVVSGNRVRWTENNTSGVPHPSTFTPTALLGKTGITILTSRDIQVSENHVTTHTNYCNNLVELFENINVQFDHNMLITATALTWFSGAALFITRAFTGVTSVSSNLMRGSYRNGIRVSASSGGEVFLEHNKSIKADNLDPNILIEATAPDVLMIRSNFIKGGQWGMIVNAGAMVMVHENTVKGSGSGITCAGTTGSWAQNNVFTGVAGIKLAGVTNLTGYGPVA